MAQYTVNQLVREPNCEVQPTFIVNPWDTLDHREDERILSFHTSVSHFHNKLYRIGFHLVDFFIILLTLPLAPLAGACVGAFMHFQRYYRLLARLIAPIWLDCIGVTKGKELYERKLQLQILHLENYRMNGDGSAGISLQQRSKDNVHIATLV